MSHYYEYMFTISRYFIINKNKELVFNILRNKSNVTFLENAFLGPCELAKIVWFDGFAVCEDDSGGSVPSDVKHVRCVNCFRTVTAIPLESECLLRISIAINFNRDKLLS